MKSLGEEEVLVKINRKEKQGWEYVYEQYYQALCSYANTFLSDVQLAQDIVQEVLVRTWQQENNFPALKAFVTYLYKSVYINSLLYLRTHSNRAQILQRVAEHMEESDEHLFADLVLEDVIRQLYRVIEELPADRREVIRLSLKGYSVSEIAGMLHISLSTVKTQRQRSFLYLKEKLKDYYCLLPFLWL